MFSHNRVKIEEESEMKIKITKKSTIQSSDSRKNSSIGSKRHNCNSMGKDDKLFLRIPPNKF
jgi:hypothetical protein